MDEVPGGMTVGDGQERGLDGTRSDPGDPEPVPTYPFNRLLRGSLDLSEEDPHLHPSLDGKPGPQ